MIQFPALERDYCGECPCQPAGTQGETSLGCVCLTAEAVLRCYAEGWSRTAMAPDQREECLDEIARVEGYARADYAHETDQRLARGVLSAWLDYCRDKGLI